MKEKRLQSRTTTTSHDNRNSWIDLTIFLKLELQNTFWSNVTVAPLFVEMLKELRNRILRITLEWSLFCLILLYVGLHFSMSSFRKLVLRFSVLSLNEPSKHSSWWRRLQDVLIKTNMFALALRLQKTSSRRLQDVLVKTNIFVLAIRLQNVFKTSSA